MSFFFFNPNETLVLSQKRADCPLQVWGELMQRVDELKWGKNGSGHWQTDWSRGEERAEPEGEALISQPMFQTSPMVMSFVYCPGVSRMEETKKHLEKELYNPKDFFLIDKKSHLIILIVEHTHTKKPQKNPTKKPGTNHCHDIASFGDKVGEGNIKVKLKIRENKV